MRILPKVLLVGGGGHCRSCIDVIEAEGKYQIAGIVEWAGGSRAPVLGYKVLGEDKDLPKLLEHCPNALVTIGQIKSAEPRRKLYTVLKEMGADLPTIVSPHAYVSKHTTLQEGTVVMHGAILNASVAVGANCIFNSQVLVEHDAMVGPYCHLSTGARVNGGVIVGSGSFVGSGTIIHEGVRLGSNCVIAAGSIVREDLPAETFFRGNT